MTKHLAFLLIAIFSLSLFLGCSNKTQSTLACYKGSPTCITQQKMDKKPPCLDCFATITLPKKIQKNKLTCINGKCFIDLSSLSNHSI
jgi:hypothetical protein